MTTTPDYSEAFYRRHAQRYSDVAHALLQAVYIKASHPELKGDLALMQRLQELLPAGARGLDAGCGAGARDVFLYSRKGYDIYGIDAVDENIQEAGTRHPEIAHRVSVADLRQPLEYPNAHFDFVLCNSVIQHIPPKEALQVTLPELARLLKTGAILQLTFKIGTGIATVYDKDYGSDRSFQLYDVDQIIGVLNAHGLSVVPADGDKLGGVMYFTDPKPMEHCALFARKAE